MRKVWSLDPVSVLCTLGCILLFFGALGLCDLLLAADGGFAQHHHSFRESCQNSLVPPPQRDSHKNHMLDIKDTVFGNRTFKKKKVLSAGCYNTKPLLSFSGGGRLE